MRPPRGNFNPGPGATGPLNPILSSRDRWEFLNGKSAAEMRSLLNRRGPGQDRGGTGPLSGIIDTVTEPLREMAQFTVNMTTPIRLPEPGQLIDLVSKRIIAKDIASYWLSCHKIQLGDKGNPWCLLGQQVIQEQGELWDWVLESSYELPDWADVQTLFWTGDVDYDGVVAWLKRTGMHPSWTTRMANLAPMVPPPSDLIRYVVRDNFQTDVVQRFGYTDEYTGVLRAVGKYASRYGYTQQVDVPGYGDGDLPPFTWLLAEWMSHWQLPSVGQGIQMLQRLRMSYEFPQQPRDPSGEVFTQADLDALIKTLDYPPFWRRKLAALGYNPIGIRNLRALWQTGLVTEKGIVDIFMDQGFTQRDSIKQARLIASEKEIADLISARKKSVSQIEQAYLLGILSRDEAARQIWLNRRRPGQPAADALLLDTDTQIAQANADAVTQTILYQLDLAIQLAQVKRGLVTLKRAYTRHSLDWPLTRHYLQQLGIQPNRIDELRDEWDLIVIAGKRELSPTAILKYFERGMLAVDDVRQRLLLAGFSPKDVDTLVTEARLAQVSSEVKALASVAKKTLGQKKQLAKQLAAVQAAAKAGQRALAASASSSQLEKWFSKGIINERQYRTRALALGISPEDVQHRIDYEAALAAARPPKKVPAAKAPKPGQPPAVPRGVLQTWLKKGLLTEQQFADRMGPLGYGRDAIEKFIKLAGGDPNGVTYPAEQPGPNPGAP